MLIALRIDNFTIVQHLELDFSNGMTAFTGETGAGKSIMIDALMLALGGRADASVIRPNEKACEVNATFHVAPDSEPAHWLEQHELSAEDGDLILRRVVNADGRSKAFINGTPFPLQKIKELSELLVHIHGQHQHQTLMHHATHRQQLDIYANHPSLLQPVAEAYKAYQVIEKKLQALKQLDNQKDKTDLLQFQIEELTALAPLPNEMSSLHQEHQQLHHAKDDESLCQRMMAILEGEDQISLSQQLHTIAQLLQKIPNKSATLTNAAELFQSALIQCEEGHNEIKTFADKILIDPERLNTLELRLSALHQTARKYHVEPNQLANHLQTLKEELDQLNNSQLQQQVLEEALKTAKEEYYSKAKLLSDSRQTYAKKLADDITLIIQKLGMPKGFITLHLSATDTMQMHGIDKVEYQVCTNPGMAPDILSKIASGGELSRISLAIQMVTAQRGATPTLLFDEVDVGIGGATAALVGNLLRQLGQRLQVFCVTHQAQVAASAHHHFRVEKLSDQHQTFSHIFALDEDNRIQEIARMLSGLSINKQTLLHAETLLAEVQV